MDLAHFTALIAQYHFWVLLPIAFVTGAEFGFVVGALVAINVLTVVEAATILVFGDLVPDTVYYLIGRYGREKRIVHRLSKRLNVDSEHLKNLERAWKRHTGKMMWIGKLAAGFSHWFLMAAGFSKLPIKTFYSYSLPVTLTQYTITGVLGFYFGTSLYSAITGTVRDIQTLIAGFIGVFLLYYFVSRFVRKQAKRMEEEK